MTEDASLTDFDGDGSEPDDAADPATPDDTPNPATSTYRWSPDGTACPDCGDAVERRWRDGDRLVCADCKEW
ncbi:DUF7573 domain-containing protein [Halostella salina]|uniref:DUF7573 domain-containing protein n=1 Tax=Halostella salina TaxID=1547897 RepID=UPI000EF7CFEA|nr:zinc ribbon domain-containing protein [Halostella salina]